MPILKDPPARSRSSKSSSQPLMMSEQQFIDWDRDQIRAEWVDGKVEFMNAVMGDHADLTAYIHLLEGGFVMENDLGKTWMEPFELRRGGDAKARLIQNGCVGETENRYSVVCL